MSSLWQEFLKRIIQIGFFYALLLHAHTWMPAIIKSFVMLGSHASHIDRLDPSSIFSQGISIAGSVLVPLEKLSLFSSGGIYLLGLITALIVNVSFVIIAGELVVTLIESYLILGAGVLFLGLGSSRWTNNYTVSFFTYALNVGCKLLFLYLIIGVGANMAQHWGERLVETGSQSLSPFLEVLGGSIVFLYVTHFIPSKAANILAGPMHNNFSGVTNTAIKIKDSGVGVISAISNHGNKAMEAIKKTVVRRI